jgi:hypothetical protein
VVAAALWRPWENTFFFSSPTNYVECQEQAARTAKSAAALRKMLTFDGLLNGCDIDGRCPNSMSHFAAESLQVAADALQPNEGCKKPPGSCSYW